MSSLDLSIRRLSAEQSPVGFQVEMPSYLTPLQRLMQLLNVPIVDLIGIAALFLASFLNLIDVQQAKESVALDSQVLAKLAVLAVCGLYGLNGYLTDLRVRQTLRS